MTETVANETAETVEDTKKVPDLSEFASSPLAGLVVEKAQGVMTELKTVAAKLNAAGNIGDLLQDAIKNSTDPKVQENLKKIEKANEAILAWMNENEAVVKPTLEVPSDEEIKALDESYKAGVANVKTLDTVFTNEVKATYPELSIYDYVGELPKGKRAAGAKAGQGEGSSRPRVSELAVSTDNGETYSKIEKDGKSTFSVLVGFLKKETGEANISASDLHDAWFGQNGNVSDWNTLPEQTTFNYSLKGKSYFVRVTK